MEKLGSLIPDSGNQFSVGWRPWHLIMATAYRGVNFLTTWALSSQVNHPQEGLVDATSITSSSLVLQSHSVTRSFQWVRRSSQMIMAWAKSIKLCRFINTTADTLVEPRAQELCYEDTLCQVFEGVSLRTTPNFLRKRSLIECGL